MFGMKLWRFSSMVRTFRLWRSRKGLGPAISKWQMSVPVRHYIAGQLRLCAWRLLPSGDYDYRLLTECEELEFLANDAW